MADFDKLYRELGRKIRQAREQEGEWLSQDALAKRLGISRASMVNIEAGRQHAPLHLLWQLAELLGTDLISLIPNREELLPPADRSQLDRGMMKMIKEEASGDPNFMRALKGFVSSLDATIETPSTERGSHEKRKPRR
jgi:DNA-binding XRE family transcriptional regulator